MTGHAPLLFQKASQVVFFFQNAENVLWKDYTSVNITCEISSMRNGSTNQGSARGPQTVGSRMRGDEEDACHEA